MTYSPFIYNELISSSLAAHNKKLNVPHVAPRPLFANASTKNIGVKLRLANSIMTYDPQRNTNAQLQLARRYSSTCTAKLQIYVQTGLQHCAFRAPFHVVIFSVFATNLAGPCWPNHGLTVASAHLFVHSVVSTLCFTRVSSSCNVNSCNLTSWLFSMKLHRNTLVQRQSEELSQTLT